MLEKKSFSSVGLAASIIMVVGYLILTVLIGIDPQGLSTTRTMEEWVASNLSVTATWKLLFALLTVVQSGFILALIVHQLVDSHKYQAQTVYLGIIGLAACLISSVNWLNSRDSMILAHQAVLLNNVDPNWLIQSPIDPAYVWSFGMLGVFYFLFGILAIISKTFTRGMRVGFILLGLFSALISVNVFFDVVIPITETEGLKLFFPFAGLTSGIFAPLVSILSIGYFRKALRA